MKSRETTEIPVSWLDRFAAYCQSIPVHELWEDPATRKQVKLQEARRRAKVKVKTT